MTDKRTRKGETKTTEAKTDQPPEPEKAPGDNESDSDELPDMQL